MDAYLFPSAQGIALQAAVSLLVGVLIEWSAFALIEWWKEWWRPPDPPSEGPDDPPSVPVTDEERPPAWTTPRRWTVLAAASLLTFAVLGKAYAATQPAPSVHITRPVSGERVPVDVRPSGGGITDVAGRSESVFGHDLRIHLLVHPVRPYAAGWWLQPSVSLHDDGSWSGTVQIGNAEWPPQSGHVFEIVAAVVPTSSRSVAGEHVSDVRSLPVEAQSDVVRVTVDTVRAP